MIFFFKKLLSYSPLFCLSCDNYFGELKKDSTEVRFSVFKISLGANKFYFFTKQRGKKFEKYFWLKLSKLQGIPNSNELKTKGDSYGKLLAKKSDSVVKVLTGALKYKIAQDEKIEDRSISKMVHYVTISIFLFPVMFYLIQRIEANVTSAYIPLCLWLFSGYILVNIYLFFHLFFKVTGGMRFSFKELKENSNPEKLLPRNIYQEWYSISRERLIKVTYIKNVEKYIIILVLIVIVLYGFQACDSVKLPHPQERTITVPATRNRVVLELSPIIIQEENAHKLSNLSHILTNLSEGTLAQVVILKNINIDYSNYDDILKVLHLFNVKNIPLIEIDMRTEKDREENNATIIPIRR